MFYKTNAFNQPINFQTGQVTSLRLVEGAPPPLPPPPLAGTSNAANPALFSTRSPLLTPFLPIPCSSSMFAYTSAFNSEVRFDDTSKVTSMT